MFATTRWITWIVLLAWGAGLCSACGLPGKPIAETATAETGEQAPAGPVPGGKLPPGGTPAPDEDAVEPQEEPPGGEGELSPAGADLAPCPADEGALIIKFTANLTLGIEGAKLTHTLGDGVLNLWLEGDGPEYRVVSLEPPAIPYTLSGSLEGCALEGQGTMTPEVHGVCRAGVLNLIISEDWAPAEGSVVCEGESSPLPPMPALGKMVHAGADGQGEVFPLERSFSEIGAGYSAIRPFAQGEGEHIWTVYVDPYLKKKIAPAQP